MALCKRFCDNPRAGVTRQNRRFCHRHENHARAVERADSQKELKNRAADPQPDSDVAENQASKETLQTGFHSKNHAEKLHKDDSLQQTASLASLPWWRCRREVTHPSALNTRNETAALSLSDPSQGGSRECGIHGGRSLAIRDSSDTSLHNYTTQGHIGGWMGVLRAGNVGFEEEDTYRRGGATLKDAKLLWIKDLRTWMIRYEARRIRFTQMQQGITWDRSRRRDTETPDSAVVKGAICTALRDDTTKMELMGSKKKGNKGYGMCEGIVTHEPTPNRSNIKLETWLSGEGIRCPAAIRKVVFSYKHLFATNVDQAYPRLAQNPTGAKGEQMDRFDFFSFCCSLHGY
ncbi:hypothetical protein Efla_001122 [Eimeria flavescens]